MIVLRYVHSLPYVILNKRTAVTRSVERRLVRSGVKTNPCISANIFYSLPLLFLLLLSFSFFYFISPTVSKTPPGEAAFWAWWIPQGRPGLALASLLFAH